MWIVNDFTRKIDRPVGELFSSLIGIINSAVDAVTETKFFSKMDRGTSISINEIIATYGFDEFAVVITGEFVCHYMLEI